MSGVGEVIPKTVNNLRFEDLSTFSFVFILFLMLRVYVLSFLFIHIIR
jgi:hypothetical protein